MMIIVNRIKVRETVLMSIVEYFPSRVNDRLMFPRSSIFWDHKFRSAIVNGVVSIRYDLPIGLIVIQVQFK